MKCNLVHTWPKLIGVSFLWTFMKFMVFSGTVCYHSAVFNLLSLLFFFFFFFFFFKQPFYRYIRCLQINCLYEKKKKKKNNNNKYN